MAEFAATFNIEKESDRSLSDTCKQDNVYITITQNSGCVNECIMTLYGPDIFKDKNSVSQMSVVDATISNTEIVSINCKMTNEFLISDHYIKFKQLYNLLLIYKNDTEQYENTINFIKTIDLTDNLSDNESIKTFITNFVKTIKDINANNANNANKPCNNASKLALNTTNFENCGLCKLSIMYNTEVSEKDSITQLKIINDYLNANQPKTSEKSVLEYGNTEANHIFMPKSVLIKPKGYDKYITGYYIKNIPIGVNNDLYDIKLDNENIIIKNSTKAGFENISINNQEFVQYFDISQNEYINGNISIEKEKDSSKNVIDMKYIINGFEYDRDKIKLYPLEVGDKVAVKVQSDTESKPIEGTISMVNDTGNYSIKMDDNTPLSKKRDSIILIKKASKTNEDVRIHNNNDTEIVSIYYPTTDTNNIHKKLPQYQKCKQLYNILKILINDGNIITKIIDVSNNNKKSILINFMDNYNFNEIKKFLQEDQDVTKEKINNIINELMDGLFAEEDKN